MAKRTRRDLSDPTIKRIVKKQTAGNSRSSDRGPGTRSKAQSNGNALFYAVLAILVVGSAAAFFALNPDSASGLFQSEPAITSNPDPISVPGTPQTDDAVAETSTENPIRNVGNLNSDTAVDPAPEREPLVPTARRTQVEILNGCGANGVAAKLKRYLRQHNVDVVSTGNYKHFEVPRSKIWDRVDHQDKSKTLALLMGISSGYVSVQKDHNLQLDATIILGLDYKNLKPFKE